MLAALRDIVGPTHVGEPDPELAELDGVPLAGVVRPGDADEVAACLRAAAASGIAIVPSGGGTKLAFGNVAQAKSLAVLKLDRLAEPPILEPDEGIATAGAGVDLGALSARLASSQRRSAFPGLPSRATVGGSIAVDPLTLERTATGGLRQDLLGLTVALADGTVARCGGRVVKNVTGFDLVRLYCGSLGSLCVITEATFRLRPLPETRRIFARRGLDARAAVAVTVELATLGVAPVGAAIRPDGTSLAVLWCIEGQGDDVEERASRVAADTATEAEWADAAAALDGGSAEVKARGVDGARDAVSAPAGRADGQVVLRVGTRPSELGSVLAAIDPDRASERLIVALPVLGGALVAVAADRVGVWQERALRERWLLWLESAPVSVKRACDVFGPAPDSLPLLRRIKAQFDPTGTLSPGRFVGGI